MSLGHNFVKRFRDSEEISVIKTKDLAAQNGKPSLCHYDQYKHTGSGVPWKTISTHGCIQKYNPKLYYTRRITAIYQGCAEILQSFLERLGPRFSCFWE